MLKNRIQKVFSYFGVKIVRICQYIEPVAPFNVLELAVLRQLSEDKETFYFLKIGADDRALPDTLDQLRRKHSLRGSIVPSDLDCDSQSFDKFISTLPETKISLLHIDADEAAEKAIYKVLAVGLFPEIINFGWTSISDEKRFSLKMMLLDNRYRFIDVGEDTVCVRGNHE
jgi:hypothetical protein